MFHPEDPAAVEREGASLNGHLRRSKRGKPGPVFLNRGTCGREAQFLAQPPPQQHRAAARVEVGPHAHTSAPAEVVVQLHERPVMNDLEREFERGHVITLPMMEGANPAN
ncbi:hypothetical protein [Deinococcus planocerae]|uniref:hypothetical protein n=1 Tax=Deinococcus planocerae TaxID=1737569 RepID=UPI0011AF08DE|nr:hypothetical protein [Deinococcus planocerae]